MVAALTGDPTPLLTPLRARLHRLATQQRYEEAAHLRDRAAALARALERQRRHDALRRAGRMELEVMGEGWAVIDRGVLCAAGRRSPTAPPLPIDHGDGNGGAPPESRSPVTSSTRWPPSPPGWRPVPARSG